MIDVKKRTARNRAWDAQNTKTVGFKFMLKSDADILEALEKADKKADFVRKAIRFYLANNKEEE